MRKYWRLALTLTALFSLVAMFIYRYKYHTLRSLIDMMNFFTTTKEKSSKCISLLSNNNLTSEIIFKTNQWTPIFGGVYLYSLHVLSRNVFSLAFSSDISVYELKNIKCSLWFEKKDTSVPSTFHVHPINSKTTSLLFYLECKSAHSFGNPYAITFMKNNVSNTLPIFHKQQYTGPYAACVSPLQPAFSDEKKILEFLIYHSHLGIKHFLFYYTTLSSSVRELLINISQKCDIIIEFLPWITPVNFDHRKINLQPFSIDCIFHISSLNHSKFAFLLDINTFLALETQDLDALISDYSPFDFLQLEKQLFCLEYPDDIFAKELSINFTTLLKTKVLSNLGQQMNVIFDIKHMMSSIASLPNGFEKWLLTKNNHTQKYKKVKSMTASIFSYTNCKNLPEYQFNTSYTHKENKKMWSFKPVYFKSCIYKLSTVGDKM